MPISLRNFADLFAEIESHDRVASRIVVHPNDFGVIEDSDMFDRYSMNYRLEDSDPPPLYPVTEGMFWGTWVNVDAAVPQGKVLVFTADREGGSYYALEPEEAPPAPEPQVYKPTQWERLLSGVDTEG